MAALELVVAAVGGLVALGVHVSSKKRRSALWRARLEACGVTDIEQGDGFVGSGDVTGRRGRHEVRVERYHRGKNVRGTRVVARGLDEALSVRREGFGASVRKAFGSEEVVFGDPAFDQATWLRGSETVVRGLLDAETRMLVSHALGGTFHGPTGVVTCRDTTVEVENGELRVEFRDGFHSNDEPQVERLGAILSLAERLARAPDRAARLAHNARHDPVPGVRGRALATLADSFADDSATREAMRAALADEHPEVRLQAALWLEDEGRPTLASLAAASDVPDGCSAVALDWLAHRTRPPGASWTRRHGSIARERCTPRWPRWRAPATRTWTCWRSSSGTRASTSPSPPRRPWARAARRAPRSRSSPRWRPLPIRCARRRRARSASWGPRAR